MRLIVGLGNPGNEYALQRHNIGFMAVDAIAHRHSFSPWKSKEKGLVAEGTIGSEKVMLLKPQTYMNKSGVSVGPIARFYKIDPKDVIVIHDELDIAAGKVKVKVGGGVAGHNGLKSIAQLFSNDTTRIRLGIGHPGDKSQVHGHVLSNFTKTEKIWLDPLMDAMADAIALLVKDDASGFMTRVALLTKPQRPNADKTAATSKQKTNTDQAPKGAATEKTPSTQPQATPSNALSAALMKAFGKSADKE